VKSARLVEQICRWANVSLLRRVEARLYEKHSTQQELNSCWANILRLAFASEGGRTAAAAAAGGIRDEPVGGHGEVVSAEKKENELAMSSRAGPVTHLAGRPTSRVPSSYVLPSSRERLDHIPQKRGGACSRGSRSKRERGEEGGGPSRFLAVQDQLVWFTITHDHAHQIPTPISALILIK